MKAGLLLLVTIVGLQVTQNSAKKLVCYFGSWAVYRPAPGKFDVEDIDPKLCTHIIFGFVGLSGNSIKVLDTWNELEDDYGKGAFKRFVGLKSKNPGLKALVAIGGWNEGSASYSTMSSTASNRKAFAESSVAFLKKHKFDGLDMDWEYPANRGGRSEDKANYVLLLKDLKEAFAPHGFLLTAAVSAGKGTMDSAYDVPQVAKYLDFINIMSYDYHGGWETVTGHNSPLYARPDESYDQQTLNTNWSVNYWLNHGTPKDKIIVGIGLYGRAFTLSNPSNNGLKAQATQAGKAGPYTREAGMLGYNEICESFQKEKWTVVWDDHYKVPYAYKDNQWVGYDDQKSVSTKVQYILDNDLGGGMVWSVETDDFRGTCFGQKYPLLTIMHKGLLDGKVPPVTNPPVRPTEGTSKPVVTETPPKPVTNPSGRGCASEGWFRDPNDCSRYWRCYKSGAELRLEEYQCSAGTVFDTSLNICNWAGTVAGC